MQNVLSKFKTEFYMRVLNCGDNYFITGGSDSYMFALTELLESHSHDVIPFAPSHKNNRPTQWSEYFPDCVNKNDPKANDVLKYLYNNQAKKKLNKLLSNSKIDVAHLHIYYGSLTGSIFSEFENHSVPVVQSLHEYKLACPVFTMVSNGKVCEDCQGHKFWRAIPKKCKHNSLGRSIVSVVESYITRWLGAEKKVDHFIAVSEFMKQKMQQYDIGNNKISTVHNFVDANKFIPSNKEGEYFFYFGRLEKLKGLFTLIDACSELVDTKLIIAGTGTDAGEINQYIAGRKLSHIKMVGFQSGENLQDLIKNSICTILPSEWYENCPMSVLESLAYAKPVVGARIGGIPELIENKVDGFLFEPGDSTQLKEILSWLATNKKMANKMGVKGREKIEKRFNRQEHYRKIIDVYNKVI